MELLLKEMKALNIYQIDIIQILKFILKTKCETRKATGYKSLQVKGWKINLVISKCQTAIFSNLKKKKNENHHRILHIWKSLGSNFKFQQRSLIFGNRFPPTKDTSSWKQKKNHHHLILRIQISVGTKFQLRLTIWFSDQNLASQEEYVRSKTEKVNTTIEFCIFELVEVQNFSLKSDSHLSKKIALLASLKALNKKCFLFHLKSFFRFQDI